MPPVTDPQLLVPTGLWSDIPSAVINGGVCNVKTTPGEYVENHGVRGGGTPSRDLLGPPGSGREYQKIWDIYWINHEGCRLYLQLYIVSWCALGNGCIQGAGVMGAEEPDCKPIDGSYS